MLTPSIPEITNGLIPYLRYVRGDCAVLKRQVRNVKCWSYSSKMSALQIHFKNVMPQYFKKLSQLFLTKLIFFNCFASHQEVCVMGELRNQFLSPLSHKG